MGPAQTHDAVGTVYIHSSSIGSRVTRASSCALSYERSASGVGMGFQHVTTACPVKRQMKPSPEGTVMSVTERD